MNGKKKSGEKTQRIWEAAKALEIQVDEFIKILNSLGIFVKSRLSAVDASALLNNSDKLARKIGKSKEEIIKAISPKIILSESPSKPVVQPPEEQQRIQPKVRVSELAKKMNLPSREFIGILTSLGVDVKDENSTIDAGIIEKLKKSPKKVEMHHPETQRYPQKELKTPSPLKVVRKKTKKEKREEREKEKEEKDKKVQDEWDAARAQAQETGEIIFIPEGITVKELSERLNVKVKDIIAKLMERGIFATINQPIDSSIAISISNMFGFNAECISYEEELDMTSDAEKDEWEESPRPPVVTIMGHVDHGKSTLLEVIHNISITSKEFGGITQHIGAYKVPVKERAIVFIDTPGHKAFTEMRARGAKITDIVVLVVAADDGVMPQTVEAINHCKAAKVPIIVAINKMDKPGANPMRIIQDLAGHGIVVEEFGGDVVCVKISAKKREGIGDLLDMILLISDMLNLKAKPDRPGVGYVLESRLDKNKGPVATILLQDGRISVGDYFLCGSTAGRVRTLFNDSAVQITAADPSTPVEILGFHEVPPVGSKFQVVQDEAKARQIAVFRHEQEQKLRLAKSSKLRLSELYQDIVDGKTQNLSIVLKSDVHGSLEAIQQQINHLSTSEVHITLIHAATGAITESDVLLASASSAIIVGFNVRPDKKAIEIAKTEGVEIHLFTVIFEVVDALKLAMQGLLKPIEKEVILGRAEVKQSFKVSKVGMIAGCMVIDGRILRNLNTRVIRDDIVVYEGKISSLRHYKNEASEVIAGSECGISVPGYNDITPGDIIEAFEIKTEARTL